jgi:hypothetical protein
VQISKEAIAFTTIWYQISPVVRRLNQGAFMNNTLPIWRQACTPHRDIREDAVSEALCAVDLSHTIAAESLSSNEITQ